MMNAIALDDEPPALRVIGNFCKQSGMLSLQRSFTGPDEALRYLRRFPVDLLFLDIQMPSLSGIEFCRLVPKQTMVIFVTAHSEFAVEGFNLSAVDYLLKPYTYERFLQAVQKAADYYQFQHFQNDSTQKFIFVRADYQLIKIALQDILYVEGLDDYVKISLADQRTIVARMTMKGLLEKLPVQDFIRVHRSYIVPVSRIESIRNKMISIAGAEIPVGSSFEGGLNERFKT